MLVLFFTSYIWIGDDRKLMDDGYNQTMNLNSWEIKVSGAKYHKENSTLTLSFFKKEKTIGQSSTPTLDKITLGNLSGEVLEFTTQANATNEYGTDITVYDVPSDFYYIRLYISSTTFDVEVPDTIDEFGNVISYPIKKGKKKEIWINVDYRCADFEKENVGVNATVSTATSASTDITTTAPGTTTQTTVITTAPSISSGTETTVYKTANSSLITSNTEPFVTTIKPFTTTLKPIVTSKPGTTTTHIITTTVKPGTTTKKPITTTGPITTTKPITTSKPVTTTTEATTTTKPATTTKPITTTTQATTTMPSVINVNTIQMGQNIALSVGSSTSVTPTILPTNATDKRVTWSSNRPDIASVDSNGNITAHASGKAIITATTVDGGLSASCMVTVTSVV